MALLIGFILVYHYDLHWGWYLACLLAYFGEWDVHYRNRLALERRIADLESLVRGDDD